ncbi:hypothetical protein HHI36_021238 [Cryptolaemus montrouzieri]|uniref:Potassium channel domain-containing protein n=1 Tax=Cryptolaemus montrouzieri TaxID=559131 RepID=A0ABD2MX00_9CUCU
MRVNQQWYRHALDTIIGTINGDYDASLSNQLIEKIRFKRTDLAKEKILFHHYNALLKFLPLQHQPYSPDLESSYGSVSPKTSWGKLVTIMYALVGIPLMLLYLSTTGDVLAKSFRRLYGRLCGRTPQKPQCSCANIVRVPVTLCVVIVLAYICSGAVLFSRLENWSLLEGSYFCFTSLGTIGFGDLLPGQNSEEITLCACSAYILTGMALVAMCFSLVQDEVIALFRFIGASCTRTDVTLRKDAEASSEGS